MTPTKVVHTIRFDIFMAGDINHAKQVCREYCYEVGLCVSVEPVDFIYTGGEEAGFKIGLMNYPRFPTDKATLKVRATTLAENLMKILCQQSFSIVGADETEWFSRRPSESSCRKCKCGALLPENKVALCQTCETRLCEAWGRIDADPGYQAGLPTYLDGEGNVMHDKNILDDMGNSRNDLPPRPEENRT